MSHQFCVLYGWYMYGTSFLTLKWLMPKRNAKQLRKAAQQYREMGTGDGDPAFKAGLILLADEFEREADEVSESGGSGAEVERPARRDAARL
jgi:hypothetical protein